MEKEKVFRVPNPIGPDKDPTSKVTTDPIERSGDVFGFINDGKWSELLDFLDNFVDAAREWVTEHNPDGTMRWRSLPIHLACEKQPPVEVIFNLISIYPDCIKEKNYGGDLPIHIACRECASKEVINFMILRDPYESTNQPDCEGRLPLHLAARNGTDVKVIEGLLEVNAKAARTPDDFGLLPLHWACSKTASAEVVEKLIDTFPYGIETKDTYGRVPLDLMKTNKSKERDKIIELLNRDVSYWTDSLLDTITTLSNKVVENGRTEKQRKMLDIENKALVTENCSLKKNAKLLKAEIHETQEMYLREMERVKEFYKTKMETIQQETEEGKNALVRKNKENEKKIADLRALVDDVVHKLKHHKLMEHEKEESRKELKEKAIALVRRIQEERDKVSNLENENSLLRERETVLRQQLKERERRVNQSEYYSQYEMNGSAY